MKIGARIFWVALLSIAALRFVTIGTAPPIEKNQCTGEKIFGQGIVVTEPERKDSGQIFLVESQKVISADGADCGRKDLIRIKSKLYPRIVFGDSITFEGRLSSPRNFKSDDGREFDYINFLAKDGIYLEVKSAKADIISSTTSQGIANQAASSLYGIKRSFVKSLERSLGDPHAALASGLVVGEKSALGKDLLDDFRAVGLIHIVVLSGYNITIIADALRRMLVRLPKTWGIAVGGLGIIAFGIMVGGGATVVRSCLMACIALSADLVRREYDVRIALIFAALVMLIENPRILLFDPSFQLSFLATLGLIALASPFEKRLCWITEKFGIRGIVASTLATQIFVSPFILYTMGQLSIIGMVVNILVLPIIPITMLVVSVTGIAGMIVPAVGLLFGWIAHILLSYELFIVNEFAQIPLASIHVPKFSGAIVVAFYALLTTFFVMRKSFSKPSPQIPNSHYS